jgi:hypothetical protein
MRACFSGQTLLTEGVVVLHEPPSLLNSTRMCRLRPSGVTPSLAG